MRKDNLKQKTGILSILIAILVYLWIIGYIKAIYYYTNTPVVLFVLYLVFSITVTFMLYKRDLRLLSSNDFKFKKVLPFIHYGDSILDFQHIFYHETNILPDLIEGIQQSLVDKTLLSNIEKIEFIDNDKRLYNSESRTFYKSSGKPTTRGSHITVMLYSNTYGDMQNIEWWILISSRIERDKLIKFLIFSPFSFLFWIISYIKGDYNIASVLRSPYPAFYNHLDLIMEIKGIHEVIISSLVDILDKNGIDTSELKIQKAQVLNINVSGGKSTFGNIMQGAMNKITKQAKGGS